jgi:DNA modification methylase
MTASVHYSDDAVTLWHGDARRVSEFIPANSVDILCTSPPYYSLRSYTDAGEHYDGQMGSEATPREFVDNLIAATADWVKVLKPTGSIWVNLGDKYAGSGGHNNAGLQPPSAKSTLKHDGRKNPRPIGDYERGAYTGPAATRRQAPDRYNQASDGIPAKSLMGLPWRYANRVVDELGLILRECIIWQKPNGLPESVTDRCRVSHEYLFHFTRQGRYFAAMDEIREPHVRPKTAEQMMVDNSGPRCGVIHGGALGNPRGGDAQSKNPDDYTPSNPLGKLPGSVWSIPSEPLVVPDHLGVDHFAAFPSEGSIVASVLAAVAAGGLTPKEGERILWTTTTSHASSRTLTPSNPAAGNGEDSETPPATDAPHPSSSADRSNSPTELPTPCSSDRSPADSTSITSAETEDASTLTTSSQSPNGRTIGASPQPSHTAPTGTPSPTHTGGGTPASAAHANSTGHAPDMTESVWNVPSEPLQVPAELGVDHFAAFPSELPRRIILGWSPTAYCTACDEPIAPVCEKSGGRPVARAHRHLPGYSDPAGEGMRDLTYTIESYQCSCKNWTPGDIASARTTAPNIPTTPANGAAAAATLTPPTTDATAQIRPAVVLDPFIGTGTTAAVAKALGRNAIGVDLSRDYLRLAEWRVNDPGIARKVLERSGVRVPKAPVIDGQLDLLGGAA